MNRRRRSDQFVLPALTATAGLLAAAGVWAHRALGGRYRHLIIGGAATLGTAAIALAEQRVPYREEWADGADGRRTDAAYILVTGPPTAAAAAALAAAAGQHGSQWVRQRFGRTPWPTSWPLPARVALALVLAEFVHYWHHRASHEFEPLWRVHAVHHSATEMSWTNSLRFHPIDHLTLLASQSAVLLALGMDDETLVAYSVFKGIHGQIQHANVGIGSHALGLVFSGADQHRWHHAVLVDQRTVNHGAVFSLWDRVFGTYYAPSDGLPPDEVGLGATPPVPPDAAGQMVAPFRSGPWSRAS
jgi:sterol desaturase/sphingolipid hydroxylase (fatty acid hydroxylase superfamily)